MPDQPGDRWKQHKRRAEHIRERLGTRESLIAFAEEELTLDGHGEPAAENIDIVV